ncbi:hypothetical protein BgiMline_022215, partial [Biomphalaria glabrata]
QLIFIFKTSTMSSRKRKAKTQWTNGKKLRKENIGEHETQEWEGADYNLKKKYKNCTKNPGHSQFIPVHQLCLRNLPNEFKEIHLFQLVKAAANLAVLVTVTLISPNRPKFWPRTFQSYPYYKQSHSRKKRCGSGRIFNVSSFKNANKQNRRKGFTNYENCWCRKCQDSDTPSKEWWEFNMDTAAHVVFDDIEASQTTLRLFYDRDDSPVVIVDKVSVVHANIDDDFCELKCVTCDQELGNKLIQMWKHFANVWFKVLKKYKNSRSKHKLNFIVSHPHGCTKKVTVGKWNKKRNNDGKTSFNYTTCTCPGSSGAQVQCVGYYVGWMFNLVHSGTTNDGFNFSGATIF